MNPSLINLPKTNKLNRLTGLSFAQLSPSLFYVLCDMNFLYFTAANIFISAGLLSLTLDSIIPVSFHQITIYLLLILYYTPITLQYRSVGGFQSLSRVSTGPETTCLVFLENTISSNSKEKKNKLSDKKNCQSSLYIGSTHQKICRISSLPSKGV